MTVLQVEKKAKSPFGKSPGSFSLSLKNPQSHAAETIRRETGARVEAAYPIEFVVHFARRPSIGNTSIIASPANKENWYCLFHVDDHDNISWPAYGVELEMLIKCFEQSKADKVLLSKTDFNKFIADQVFIL